MFAQLFRWEPTDVRIDIGRFGLLKNLRVLRLTGPGDRLYTPTTPLYEDLEKLTVLSRLKELVSCKLLCKPCRVSRICSAFLSLTAHDVTAITLTFTCFARIGTFN